MTFMVDWVLNHPHSHRGWLGTQHQVTPCLGGQSFSRTHKVKTTVDSADLKQKPTLTPLSPLAHLHEAGMLFMIYVWHKPTEFAHSFLFYSCIRFCLYGPFNCISFHKFSWKLSTFSLCSSRLNSAWLVLSAIYLFMKVSLSPDIIFCGWLGLTHQLTHFTQLT